MLELNFQRKISSELLNVKYTIMDIMNFLKISLPNLSEEDFFELKLVFSELLINAVTHGNKNDNDKCVFLEIFIENKETVSAIICDEGVGFDYSKLLEENKKEEKLFDEHGRGICLIETLTDTIAFNKLGNEIKFKKKVRLCG